MTWRTDAEKLLSRYGTLRGYSTRDFGREKHPACVSVLIGGGAPLVEESAITKLKQVRAALPAGTVAWLGTTRWLGAEKNPGLVELAIGEGSSQLDALRHAASDAANYSLGTEDLVKRLARYHERYRIEVLHAETDTIEFDVCGEVDDWAAFAADLYEFCPDIVDQGVGSVEALHEVLIDTGRVYLWWD